MKFNFSISFLGRIPLTQPLLLNFPTMYYNSRSKIGPTFSELVFALLLGLLPCTCVLAQNPVSVLEEDEIRVLAQSYVDSVRLRWAPTNYRMWEAMRTTGLHLERNTIMRNGEMLPLAEREQVTVLTSSPIAPLPEAAFGALAAENRYVAIGGQALYGENFNLESSDADDGAYGGILNKAREQENRFSFGLFAADQSWDAASMMGLAFTDRTAKRNEVYLYRLRPVAPIEGYDPLRSGFVTVVVNNSVPPPVVKGLGVEFGDRQAVLSWDLEVASTFYVSYIVLRSSDGINFKKVNRDGLPFVPLVKPGQPQIAFFTDSLPQNNQPYFYSVMGQTPFGTLGEMSDKVQGMGLDPQPTASPSLTGVYPLENGGFTIGWTFSETALINGFKVERARKNAGPYEAVSELLPPDTRNFEDPNPLRTNYYRVTVFDQYDRPLSSYPALAQPNDETPPAIPTGLRGIILKDGRVIISWDENEEEDLLGYRIWLSNQTKAEYSLATGAPIKENYFIGTTTLNTLSPKLYAKIVSLDYRHNTSDFSDYIELLRPDTIPPAPPLMKNVRANRDSLIVSWAFSRSLDLERQELQRRPKGGADEGWMTVSTFLPPVTANSGTHADTELEKGA
ncbi:MAG: hypothetical protein AAGF89_08165, partial [Bacteroidota bacterium]